MHIHAQKLQLNNLKTLPDQVAKFQRDLNWEVRRSLIRLTYGTGPPLHSRDSIPWKGYLRGRRVTIHVNYCIGLYIYIYTRLYIHILNVDMCYGCILHADMDVPQRDQNCAKMKKRPGLTSRPCSPKDHSDFTPVPFLWLCLVCLGYPQRFR